MNVNVGLTESEIEKLVKLSSGDLKIKLQSYIKTVKKVYNISNNDSQVKLAKEYRLDLVKKQTKSEKVFKAKLKSIGIKYEFQKIVFDKDKFFIVDFYIPSHNLIVEIDGGYHTTKDQIFKDKLRTSRLSMLGYKNVKRLTNDQAINIHELTLQVFLQ